MASGCGSMERGGEGGDVERWGGVGERAIEALGCLLLRTGRTRRAHVEWFKINQALCREGQGTHGDSLAGIVRMVMGLRVSRSGV